METTSPTAYQAAPPAEPAPALTPVSAKQRIQALDVVRGFALIGICIMNVEFFNRAQAEIGGGIPLGVTGLHWWASWFSNYFVAGKFWTIFSLLFGMGFAVMLTRAKEAGRNFLVPYARRIVALAAFGAIHHVLIWPGDILFSYAVGAMMLLFTLFGNWKTILGAMLAFIALAFAIHVPAVNSYAFTLGVAGLLALYLRHEKVYGKLKMSLFSWILAGMGVLVAIALIASFFVAPMKDARFALGVATVVTFLVTLLSHKYYQPTSDRSWRLGATMYLLPFFVGLIFTSAELISPEKPASKVEVADKKAADKKTDAKAVNTLAAVPAANAASKAAASPAGNAVANSASKASDKAGDAKKSAKAVDPAEERKKRREEFMKERAEEIKNEIAVLTHGSFIDAVKMRAKSFAKHVPTEGGFASVLIGMFLLGTWFVNAGVMSNTAANLPLFRKLAYFALPAGLAMSVGSSLIATTHVAGTPDPAWNLAQVILQLSCFPVCLGYVSMIILMMHGSGPFAKVSVLGAFGRMALSNYLMQSVIASAVFYHYGLGFYGAGRAWQFGYVALLIPLQIGFSHWWLAHFHYGPMEWAWRAITYWQLPAMRIIPAAPKMSPVQAARMVA